MRLSAAWSTHKCFPLPGRYGHIRPLFLPSGRCNITLQPRPVNSISNHHQASKMYLFTGHVSHWLSLALFTLTSLNTHRKAVQIADNDGIIISGPSTDPLIQPVTVKVFEEEKVQASGTDCTRLSTAICSDSCPAVNSTQPRTCATIWTTVARLLRISQKTP